MKVFTRSIPSSDGERSYSVEFSFDGQQGSISCDCAAATNTMMCKHRERFLVTREITTFVPPADGDEIDLMYHIASSGIPAAYHEYCLALHAADQRKKDLAAEVTQIKKTFARRLAEGI